MIKVYLLTCLIFLTNWFSAQVKRNEMPKPTAPKTIGFKDSEIFTTKNGIKVILSENHKIPKVSLDLRMGYIPGFEGEKVGLGAIMGDLIMSGTNKRTKDQLDKEVDFIGASLSASSTNVFLSCLTKHLEKGLDLMSDITMNANFPTSEFDRIVNQYESNLLSYKSDADAMAQNALSAVNFPNHPYGETMTTTSLASIKLEDIKNNFKACFTPKGAYLVIVGDINRAEAEAMIEKLRGILTLLDREPPMTDFLTEAKTQRDRLRPLK